MSDEGLKAILYRLEGLMDNYIQRIYPTLGASPLITGHLNPNTYGAWVICLAAGVLRRPAWLVGIEGELDNIDIYTIQVGINTVPIADFGYEAQAANTSVVLTCVPVKLPSSPQISVRCKTVAGMNATVTDLRIIVREALA